MRPILAFSFGRNLMRAQRARALLLRSLAESFIVLSLNVTDCVSKAESAARNRRQKPRHLNPSGGVLATSYSRTAYRRTTIGAAAFHCRVRNGNGWGHCAIVTREES